MALPHCRQPLEGENSFAVVTRDGGTCSWPSGHRGEGSLKSHPNATFHPRLRSIQSTKSHTSQATNTIFFHPQLPSKQSTMIAPKKFLKAMKFKQNLASTICNRTCRSIENLQNEIPIDCAEQEIRPHFVHVGLSCPLGRHSKN